MIPGPGWLGSSPPTSSRRSRRWSAHGPRPPSITRFRQSRIEQEQRRRPPGHIPKCSHEHQRFTPGEPPVPTQQAAATCITRQPEDPTGRLCVRRDRQETAAIVTSPIATVSKCENRAGRSARPPAEKLSCKMGKFSSRPPISVKTAPSSARAPCKTDDPYPHHSTPTDGTKDSRRQATDHDTDRSLIQLFPAASSRHHPGEDTRETPRQSNAREQRQADPEEPWPHVRFPTPK